MVFFGCILSSAEHRHCNDNFILKKCIQGRSSVRKANFESLVRKRAPVTCQGVLTFSPLAPSLPGVPSLPGNPCKRWQKMTHLSADSHFISARFFHATWMGCCVSTWLFSPSPGLIKCSPPPLFRLAQGQRQMLITKAGVVNRLGRHSSNKALSFASFH